ncbi:DUF6650 family protein [Streptomyces sp. NPDC096032]|uniref:DUF6650 family protein n=1 Tax=Streptomyces sp. NPDC096032 TaxID=3366070 RepID=UPI0037F7B8CD
MRGVKLREILSRIKGFSTPLGGLEWEAPAPQRATAKKVVRYLEDRRVLTSLYPPQQVEDYDHCVASVLDIRGTLTAVLMEPDTSDALAEHLMAMRAACRRYLDAMKDAEGSNLGRDALLGAALGELRAIFGVQLGLVAERYKLDLPNTLSHLLPVPDIGE